MEVTALAKNKKSAAGAAHKKKRSKKQAKQAATAAARQQAQQVRQPNEPQRAAGGVPPVEAFDNLPRRKPPQLAGPTAEPIEMPAQQTQPVKKGKKKQQKTAAENPQGLPMVKTKGKQKAANPVKRRKRRRIAAVLGCVALIGLGVWFSLSILFKIEKYEIQGDCMYTVEQVADAFGHEPGSNMFGYVKSSAEQRIQTHLPYVEKVTLRRRLPSTIIFRVTPAVEEYYFASNEGFVVMNSSLKVLSVTPAEPEGLVNILGLEQVDAFPGQVLTLLDEKEIKQNLPEPEEEISPWLEEPELEEGGDGAETGDDSQPEDDGPPAPKTVAQTAEERAQKEAEAAASAAEEDDEDGEDDEDALDIITEPEPEPEKPPAPLTYNDVVERFDVMGVFMQALKEAGIEGINWIDVSDPLDLKFGWDDRINVRMGPKSGLEEKLNTVKVILYDGQQELISEYDRGTLDMGLYLSTGKSYFRPE